MGAVVALHCAASPASADIGLPMLAVVWPAMGVLLGPGVLVEIVVARRLLREPSPVMAVIVANLVPTLAGIPLTWLCLVACLLLTGSLLSLMPNHSPLLWIMVPFYVAWLPPGVERNQWWIPVALMAC